MDGWMHISKESHRFWYIYIYNLYIYIFIDCPSVLLPWQPLVQGANSLARLDTHFHSSGVVCSGAMDVWCVWKWEKNIWKLNSLRTGKAPSLIKVNHQTKWAMADMPILTYWKGNANIVPRWSVGIMWDIDGTLLILIEIGRLVRPVLILHVVHAGHDADNLMLFRARKGHTAREEDVHNDTHTPPGTDQTAQTAGAQLKLAPKGWSSFLQPGVTSHLEL